VEVQKLKHTNENAMLQSKDSRGKPNDEPKVNLFVIPNLGSLQKNQKIWPIQIG
jgi:hypothetical protein